MNKPDGHKRHNPQTIECIDLGFQKFGNLLPYLWVLLVYFFVSLKTELILWVSFLISFFYSEFLFYHSVLIIPLDFWLILLGLLFRFLFCYWKSEHKNSSRYCLHFSSRTLETIFLAQSPPRIRHLCMQLSNISTI